MQTYGLIGKNLSHSYSADFFNDKFSTLGLTDVCYHNFPLESVNDLQKLLLNNPSIEGLNVTIPYKTQVLSQLDRWDKAVAIIGAANTLKIKRAEGKIKITGYNTDYLGFLEALKKIDYKKHKKALILGSGGASKAIAYALDLLDITYIFVSRQNKNNKTMLYHNLTQDLISEYTFIINTTPLGMEPAINSFPDIPYDFIGNKHLLFDLVYNPEKTVFLNKGLYQNAYICNGLNMLYAQANYAWKIWNDEGY